MSRWSYGDTLAIVVNVQDVAARTPDGARTLSRNCQLPEGVRAFMQAKRKVDVVVSEDGAVQMQGGRNAAPGSSRPRARSVRAAK